MARPAPPPELLKQVQRQLRKLGHEHVPDDVVASFLAELAEVRMRKDQANARTRAPTWPN